jgi:hypothetical protein
VLEQVRRLALAREHPPQVGRLVLVEHARAARVAVVEADYEVAGRSERLAELDRPEDHLRTEAHDQQHGRVLGIAERLVGELDLAPLYGGELLPCSRDLHRLCACNVSERWGS